MRPTTAKLVDECGNILAIASVADEGTYYGGAIELRPAAANVLAMFEEFEEIVNGQMFSFLDEIQRKIDSFHIKAVFADGAEACVKDLQVFPSTGDVSFRLAGVPVLPVRRA